MKRICKKCGHSIRMRERWREIHRTFLWFRLKDQYAHHDCLHPCDGPVKTVKRLAGEVPLPFPVTTTYTYFNSETGQE